MTEPVSDSVEETRKKKIFILDDHPLFREGLSELILQQPDLKMCGEAEDARVALEQIARIKPDLVLVDISLKGMDGIEFTKHLRSRSPAVPVLVLSMHDESLYCERALRAGAKGYIMKAAPSAEFFQAIRRVLDGRIYVSESENDKLLHRLLQADGEISGQNHSIAVLSDRELEVFLLIGRGFKTREIADKLGLSIKTIECYRSHIKDKLKLRDSTALIQFASGWITSAE